MKNQTTLTHYTTPNLLNSRPIIPPIFQTSTFYFKNLQQAIDIFSLKVRNFVYTRGGNPTVNLLEERMARLEKGIAATCFSSGMGAISCTLFSLLEQGDTLVVSDVMYGSTLGLVKDIMPRLGIKVRVCDLTNLNKLQNICKEAGKIKAIFFETPCNPTLKLIDVAKIVKICKKYGTIIIVDNTLATPYFQKPLNLGVDVVIHSLSKYLNGHSDVLGGVTVSRSREFIDKLKFVYMCHFGSALDPHSAFLILRGLMTFEARMKQHEQNAKAIAEYLSAHPRVKKVIYPGKSDFNQLKIFRDQMYGGGGMISFYLKKVTHRKINLFLSHLKYIKLAVSFGGAESLIEYPLYMTHREYLKDKKTDAFHELKHLIRLSVGLENVEDLISDLNKALERLS